MMKRVISRKNLPVQFPVNSTIIAYFCLDRWGAPQWLWGAAGLLFLFIWIACFVEFSKQSETKIFSDQNDK